MFDYIIANPVGNITALVTSPVPPEDRLRIAGKLMNPAEMPALPRGWGAVEQVGFFSPDQTPVYLEMAGGEFCGNATLSAASYAAAQNGLGEGESTDIRIRVSGMPDLLTVRITYNAPVSETVFSYTGTLEMPLPESITEYRGYPLVNFRGISHLILGPDPDQSAFPCDNIRIIARELNVNALGMLFYNPADETMRPYVYVQSGDTAVWEHGCASGSAAIGAFRYYSDHNNTTTALQQPGGTIHIHFDNNRLFLTDQILLYLPEKH